MPTNTLKDALCKGAKAGEKLQKLYDGGGLFLAVLPTGAKIWRLAYRYVGKPTFIGHYWLTGVPTLLSPTTACVDYSVAKGGRLVAYRWNGEQELQESNFCWVGR